MLICRLNRFFLVFLVIFVFNILATYTKCCLKIGKHFFRCLFNSSFFRTLFFFILYACCHHFVVMYTLITISFFIAVSIHKIYFCVCIILCGCAWVPLNSNRLICLYYVLYLLAYIEIEKLAVFWFLCDNWNIVRAIHFNVYCFIYFLLRFCFCCSIKW